MKRDMHDSADAHLHFLDEEELLDCVDRVVYRATRHEDGTPVIIQLYKGKQSIQDLKAEADLLSRVSSDAILSPLSITTFRDTTSLVLQDPGGEFLSLQLPDVPVKIATFLKFAIATAHSLSKVHDAGIVHRAIRPDTLFVESGGDRVRLTHFADATTLPRSSQHLGPQHFGDDSLAYLAPEQTGRINRQVDRRADLYAIGVVFYRLLSGALPFGGDHPLDVLHGHMARNPAQPTELNPSVPHPISSIVVKLLQKNAEDRYRSAHGLLADLVRCREHFKSIGHIEPFPLAEYDPVEHLEIAEKLYGRGSAVEQLVAAFKRVSQGGVELLTVTGYSGIGKTSLVNALQEPVLAGGGYFAAGKFDQLARDEPYSALIQALTDLVRQLLTEDDAVISDRRKRILAALGENAQVVLDVIPDLDLILGPQRPVASLGPTENRNRLELQFQRLFTVLGARNHPLVLFLDDLQWADSASLTLIESLLVHAKPECFLLLGAYRNNEVPPHHPLRQTFRTLQDAGAPMSECVLVALALDEISSMLVDTFGCTTEEVHSLAALVHEKTLGNPFFARTFLESAFAQGLLKFVQSDGWQWDVDRIRQAQPTDNVIDLLASTIGRLPKKSREVLELAACVGNRFDIDTLTTVAEADADTIHHWLVPPFVQGLIEATQGNDFTFCHDRIQEAAYRRIAADQRDQFHLHIGTLLLQQVEGNPPGERIFDITDHLNHALHLVEDHRRRRIVARLNLDAANRARKSAAFEAALRYYEHGIQWLADRDWIAEYDLVFALHLGRAEAAFLCGQPESAEADTAVLLKRAKTNLERGEVYALKMVQYENSGRFAEAVEAGKSALSLFGIDFPADRNLQERAMDTALADIEQALEVRPTAELVGLPTMEDPESRMSMRLLMTLWPSAYIAGNKALTVLIAARMVSLSLAYGNSPESAYGYVTHAITLGAVKRAYGAAYEYGRLALNINRRFDDLRSRAKINHMFSCYIGFWSRPIDESFAYSREAFNAGVESGDFIYAAYGCFHESWHALFSGMNLGQFEQTYGEKLDFLERAGNRSFRDAHQLMLQWGNSLQGKTSSPGDLGSARFDESMYLSLYRQAEFFVAFHHIAKLHLLYLFGDYRSARDMADQAQSVALGIRGMIWDAWLCLYRGLAITAWCAENGTVSASEREQLRQSIDLLALWAKNCPRNFAHQHFLLLAEQARLTGEVSDAIDCYEAAISHATEAAFVHDQALAKERYATFWLARGNTRLARFYLTDAIADYAHWGAEAKVHQLTQHYGATIGHQLQIGPGHDPLRDRDSMDSTAIIGATRALSEELNSERVAEVLLDLLVRNAGAQRAVLFRVEEQTLIPALQAATESGQTAIDTGNLGNWRGKVAEKAVNYVLHTRRSLLTGDAIHDERLAADPYVAEHKVRSIICTPMLNQSDLQGLLYIENRLTLDAFTHSDLGIAEILANQAAVSLKNSRLFDGLQREVSRREKAESRLRDVAKGTAGAVGEHLFRELVRHLSQAMQVRIAFVTECSPPDRERVRALAFIDNGEFLDDVEYDLEGTPCREVIDGNVCFYPSCLEKEYPKEKGLESYLGVPMHGADGTIIGHLAVADDKPLSKSPDDESLLIIFATRAGTELERQKAQKVAEESRRILAERERLASLGEFASMITHEIRSPLSTIEMAFDYLHNISLPEKATRRLDLASMESRRLQSLLSEILLFAKPQALTRKHFDMDALIRECLSAVKPLSDRPPKATVYRCLADDVGFEGDEDKLKQVLINLVTNAHQAIADEQEVMMELADDDDGRLQITVRNPGRIADDALSKLTEPFFTTKAQGTGLGLAIVKRIVDAHGGVLDIANEQDHAFIRVTVVLPR
ncbi:MAG: AAA family ATPase [Gammaproteobacteria bacterium]|nr:AAA family ATPase [Gammaproteobacteria bacterium]